MAESEEALPEDLVKEEAFHVMRRWNLAENQQVNPLTPQPKFTEEHVALGKKAFYFWMLQVSRGRRSRPDERQHRKGCLGRLPAQRT